MAPAVQLGAPLTLRELQCVVGAAMGMHNRDIGKRLFISEDTVKTHFRRALRKLGAKDRAHAVTLSIAQRYLTVSPTGKVEPGERHPWHPGNTPDIPTQTRESA